ncbi:protein windpipe [Dendroctonus ponderosae]|uniref:LRRCT domain-containing protein n=1 Tax=Dendroctonus ponderosae TaxID=77166 RepID=A0AAR5PHI2_DENPD|nr:protein windpipe [Dendroctonus ponderosae]
MWKLTVILLSLAGPILGASIFHCPEGTTCPEKGSVISPSFQFLDKLGPKQFQTIFKLSIVNASLSKIPAELKYVKNLEYLDLSGNSIQLQHIPSLVNLKTLKLARNNIKDIILSLLPKHIEDLDLSNNLLSQIPRDWKALKELKTIHLQNNPLDCNCYNENILYNWKFIKGGVHMPEPVICAAPKHAAGKNINIINCSIEDDMINDQEEGSGSHKDFIENEPTTKVPYLHEEDEVKVEENEIIDDPNYLPVEDELISVVNASAVEEHDEGSGDEGSGFLPLWDSDPVNACVFNCSTPVPIGVDDDQDDTRTGPADPIKVIAEDLYDSIFEDLNPSTSTTAESTTAISSSTPPSSSSEVTEEIIKKESDPAVYKEFVNNDVDILSNDTRTGEMEKATALNQNNYAVYVVVVCGLLLAIIFSICLVKKRQTKRLNKKRRELPSGFGEEMKPLEKPSIKPINEKNGKPVNHTAEQIPLVNGQNGKARDEPVLTSYIPLEHPESTIDLNHDTDSDEPTIRPKNLLLTPMTERVTIRASEIPESIPKTPVFIHRQKNSEGEIITTVVPP